jgi:hypothetical protein
LTPRAIEGVVRFHDALAEAMADGPPSEIPNLKSEISNLKSQISDLKSQTSSGAAPPAADLRSAVRLLVQHLTEPEAV